MSQQGPEMLIKSYEEGVVDGTFSGRRTVDEGKEKYEDWESRFHFRDQLIALPIVENKCGFKSFVYASNHNETFSGAQEIEI